MERLKIGLKSLPTLHQGVKDAIESGTMAAMTLRPPQAIVTGRR
jgi:hypothetical protein